MEFIRDAHWYSSYSQALRDLKMDDDQATRYANAAWRLNANYRKHDTLKKENSTKVIYKAEPTTGASAKTCKATLMSGKTCSYKACCGEYCKRHRIVDLNVVKK